MTQSPVWHPFTQHGLGDPIPLIVRAEGAILHTGDGRRIVDAISSWWVTTHGHCNPRISAAIADVIMLGKAVPMLRLSSKSSREHFTITANDLGVKVTVENV